MDKYPNFLIHYGRKGMKWGQHIFGDDTTYTSTSGSKSSSSGGSYSVSAGDTYSVSNTSSGESSTTKHYNVKTKAVKKDKIETDNKPKELDKKDSDKKSNNKKSDDKKDKAAKTAAKGKSWFTQNIKSGKDKPNVSAAEKVTSTSEKGIDNLVKLRKLRDSHKMDKQATKSLSEISTEDLRKIVANAKERSALEDDYRKYVANNISSGRKRATETLENMGADVAVVGSMVTIISTVKSFKDKD